MIPSVRWIFGCRNLIAVFRNNEPSVWWMQIVGILTIFFSVFVTSLIAGFILRLTVGSRVDEEHEYAAVDLCERRLKAYPEFTNTG